MALYQRLNNFFPSKLSRRQGAATSRIGAWTLGRSDPSVVSTTRRVPIRRPAIEPADVWAPTTRARLVWRRRIRGTSGTLFRVPDHIEHMRRRLEGHAACDGWRARKRALPVAAPWYAKALWLPGAWLILQRKPGMSRRPSTPQRKTISTQNDPVAAVASSFPSPLLWNLQHGIVLCPDRFYQHMITCNCNSTSTLRIKFSYIFF